MAISIFLGIRSNMALSESIEGYSILYITIPSEIFVENGLSEQATTNSRQIIKMKFDDFFILRFGNSIN